MSDHNSTAVREAVFEVLENQMRDGTPPETRQTFDRLIAEGHSRDETMDLLASVLLFEMDQMVRAGEVFNQTRFAAALNGLPDLPPDKDD